MMGLKQVAWLAFDALALGDPRRLLPPSSQRRGQDVYRIPSEKFIIETSGRDRDEWSDPTSLQEAAQTEQG
jgi:hypothetical protein